MLDPADRPINHDATAAKTTRKLAVVIAVLAAIAISLVLLGDSLSLSRLAEREAELRHFQLRHPFYLYGIAFIVYVLVTGLSLPFATGMSLLLGWYLGFWRAFVLVSFASTAGATLAFLLSRYLFRDAVRQKFGQRMLSFNKTLKKEGAFYLFTLRLFPGVPFFAVNVVMGLTPIRTWTFWWVSQLGMLPGTMVYIYAGAQVPGLQVLADEGAQAVFSATQLTRLTAAFLLLGFFPVLAKLAMRIWSNNNATSA